MTTLNIWRIFRGPVLRISVRSLSTVVSHLKVQQPHIYKRTFTADELVKHFADNVVYESKDLIVTSIPQGVGLLNDIRWLDCDDQIICPYSLQDLVPKLCETFKEKFIFVAKHPRRNSSGVLILTKNIKALQHIRADLELAESELRKVYTYLAVVLGYPTKSFKKIYNVDQGTSGDLFYTEILEHNEAGSSKIKTTKYEHTVLDSSNDISLVQCTVSYDSRDCVRHILAKKCFTPVFGDSWSIKRTVKFLFGAPIKNSIDMKPQPYKLSSDVLKKINLSEDEQNIIPIHLHLYGLTLSVRSRSQFFVSVPPPESFIWTCKQIGLNSIEDFTSASQKR